MDLVPQLTADDRLMLTGVDMPFVRHLSDVGPVVQQLVDVGLVDWLAALGRYAGGSQDMRKLRARADVNKALKRAPNDGSLGVVDDELAVLHLVTQRHSATHP